MNANASPTATPCRLRRRTARSNAARSERSTFARGPEQLAGERRKMRDKLDPRIVEVAGSRLAGSRLVVFLSVQDDGRKRELPANRSANPRPLRTAALFTIR